ncbi:MAG: hypothetical protein LUF92_14395 [Clostridiales bacterium]|nr:hypothetical protein [Clostridiales bacterium]
MALRSTSDRYKYIYGSNATRLDSDYGTGTDGPQPIRSPAEKKAATVPERQANPQKNTSGRKSAAALTAFDGKYTLIVAIAVFLCVAASLVYVRGTVRLYALSTQDSELKTEKSKLQSRQTALQTEIDKNINLEEIRAFAEEELNMVYPGSDQVIYYESDTSDYFRQYESIDVGN